MLPDKPRSQKSRLLIITTLIITLFSGWLVINSQAATRGDIINFLPLILNSGEAQPTSTPTPTASTTATTTSTPGPTSTTTPIPSHTSTATATTQTTSTPTSSATSTVIATTTETSTATATSTAQTTSTPTITSTPTGAQLFLIPNCGHEPTATFVVYGVNWPSNEDVFLYWHIPPSTDTLVQVVPAPHGSGFAFNWTRPVTNGVAYLVKAESASYPLGTIQEPFTVPCATPTPTSTGTPAATPTVTTTPAATPTVTGTPAICSVQFETEPLHGTDFVLVTGEVGTIVTIIDLTTGDTLGSDTLLSIPGHACDGYADFSPPNQLNQTLVAGHVLLAQGDDGTFDTGIVLSGTATPTPTTGPTSTPSPSPTITPTTDPASTATSTPTPQNTPIVTNTPDPVDLVVIDPPKLIGTQPISVNMPVDFQIVMTNTGQTAVTELFFVDLFFNPTAVTPTIPITETNGYAGFSYFAGGDSRIITITSYIGFTDPITMNSVYAMVDSLQTVVESSETNNISDELLVEVSFPPVLPPIPTPGVTPSPTPSALDTQTSISGIVRRLEGNWLPQFRAYVILIEQISGNSVQTTEADSNGYYEFNNLPAGTYTVKACLRLDGVDYVGLRAGIILPDPFANVYMLPGPCT